MIIFYLFFAHGSGNSAEQYVKDDGVYWGIAYVLTGIVHLFLLYYFYKMHKQIKLVLAIVLTLLYFLIFYFNF